MFLMDFVQWPQVADLITINLQMSNAQIICFAFFTCDLIENVDQ